LLLDFNEKLEQRALTWENFILQPATTILKSSFTDISLKTIELDVKDLQPRVLYTLEVNNVFDCSHNEIQSSQFFFGLPEGTDSLDVVINEILFNPISGGVDFVEVMNVSSKFINLRNWKLASYKNGVASNPANLFTKNVLLPPNEFAVFTTDPSIVTMQYASTVEKKLYKTLMPSLPDDEGSIIIVNDSGKIVDAVSYSKDWHSVFIKNKEGVSLERLDWKSPSNDPANWTSASATQGYGTPGATNSQARGKGEMDEEEVLIVPEIFSPGTSTNDFVQIRYRFSPGAVANVRVYDPQGHLLRTLATNETLGSEGFLRWDGDKEDGSKARMGYYIVWFEIFNSTGAVKTFRKRVILSSW